jgi:tripartite-type tricarboxylate transporter receptor subunit TctC
VKLGRWVTCRCTAECPLLAQSGHHGRADPCPLLGGKADYRGAGQAVTDLVAGSVKFGILGPTALLPHVRAGALMFIAQTGEKRSAVLPDVPTLIEAGYKGMVLVSWFVAPAGMVADVINALNNATGKALEDSVLRENFTNATLETVGGTPEDLAGWRAPTPINTRGW